MPKVAGKKYPYTKAGMKRASVAKKRATKKGMSRRKK